MQQPRQRFNPEGPLTAVDFVIEQVTAHNDGDLSEWEPLGECVSGDAINDLFGGRNRRPALREGALTFQWESVRVTVDTDGRVEVQDI